MKLMPHYLILPLFAVLLCGNVDMYGQTAYNPNVLPLGDKESLMANTGTGGIKSTGAVYYNPGALTMEEEIHFPFRDQLTSVFNSRPHPSPTLAVRTWITPPRDFRPFPSV